MVHRLIVELDYQKKSNRFAIHFHTINLRDSELIIFLYNIDNQLSIRYYYLFRFPNSQFF